MQNDLATLRAADRAWLKACSTKDVAKSVAFFDKQGSMLVPHSPLATGQAIANLFAEGYALRDYKLTWHPNRVGVARSGDLGYTSGKYQLSFTDEQGRTVRDKGKYLMVWKKQQNGEWKVLFDTSCSDLPVLHTHL